MEIESFQGLIERTYKEKDARRGVGWTFAWFVEEVGELGRALRQEDRDAQREEFADAFAWLCGLANLADVDLAEAVATKYGRGCPLCAKAPCECHEAPVDKKEGST